MVGFVAPTEGVIDLTISEDEDHEDLTTNSRNEGGRDGKIGRVFASLSANQHSQGHQTSQNQQGNLTTPSKPASFIKLNDGSPVPNSNVPGMPLSGAAASPFFPSRASKTQAPNIATPRRPTIDIDSATNQLQSFEGELEKCNARIVRDTLQQVIRNAPQRQHVSATDAFADLTSLAQNQESENCVQVKFKLYSGSGHKKRSSWFPVTPARSDRQRVPRYRFHHVQISKNILTPNTMLKFLPHLRDLRPEEEPIYNQWTQELQNMDRKIGMASTALDPRKKAEKTRRDEHAAVLYAYLDRWLQRLGLHDCKVSTLIRYMASQAPAEDDAITPQQKTSLLQSSIGNNMSPHAEAQAKVFTDAFNAVFGSKVTLTEVLRLDETVDTVVETSKKVKETPSSQKPRGDLLLSVETALATYASEECVICYSHDCEHGEYLASNEKRQFSLHILGGLRRQVEKKWAEQARQQLTALSSRPTVPCRNQCCMVPPPLRHQTHVDSAGPWTDSEVEVLTSMFAMFGRTSVQPDCAVASILGRKCYEVYEKRQQLSLTLPNIRPPPPVANARSLTWYDRHEKVLRGDWQEYTISHDYSKRLVIDPCCHDGPCSAATKCPCVLNKLLCERFCQCTAECCAYKFTGCACHSTGKTCLQRQKEGKKPCICVLLNRECDPILCSGCGASERADPLNAHDEDLHATGCQNVALQRGVAKPVLMGESQLEGCGYGLFAATDIAQDEYVIEYTGELILHDEGVRREARRGDVFDESSSSSYLFTLLDTEGIWVDAAIYGNLSRYINHAGEGDKKGANVTPKILYVSGEYRIRFTAMRDIKCGEELFFNYGENFPNLTKKLLEDNKDASQAGKKTEAESAPVRRKPGRPPGSKTALKTVPDSTDIKGKQKELDIAPETKPSGRSRADRRKAGKTAGTSRDMTGWEPDLDEGFEDEVDEEYQPHRKRTQGELDAYNLARDRRRRTNAGSKMVAKSPEASEPDAPVGPVNTDLTPTNAPKKRGGARPGAGRKRKKTTGNAQDKSHGALIQNSPAAAGGGGASMSATGDLDSDDEPLTHPRSGGSVSQNGEPRFKLKTSPYATPSRRSSRKRKASEIAETPEEGTKPQSDRVDTLASVHDTDDDDEDDETEEGGMVRSRRKRQKPLRYQETD